MADDIRTVSPYERDFFEWTRDQAERLRAARDFLSHFPLRQNDLPGLLDAVDWENLAEEIASLGQRDRRELASRLETIVEHLVKLECSPAIEPRRGWINTVARERREIERILEDSPSLRRSVPDLMSKCDRVAELTVNALKNQGETTAAACERLLAAETIPYTPEQVLSDWWPAPPDNGSAGVDSHR